MEGRGLIFKALFSMLSLAAFVSLFISSAGALASGQSYITIGETPFTYSLFVENTSSQKKPLEITVNLPTRHEITKMPKWVMPKSKEEIKIRVFPEKGFENATYVGRIDIDLGGSIAEKIVNITYVEEDNCPLNIIAQQALQGSNGQGNSNAGNGSMQAILFAIENKSYVAKEVSLAEAKAGNWQISEDSKRAFAIGAFETRNFKAFLEGKEEFNGNADFTFKCKKGFAKASQDVSLKAKGNDIIGQGLAILPSIGLGEAAEFALNAFLAIAAVILLIAFMARLVNLTKSKKALHNHAATKKGGSQ